MHDFLKLWGVLRRAGWTAVALGALVGRPAAAQTTFNACYVASVGALYIVTTTPAVCRAPAPSHVLITWTDGAVADNAVTSAKIADGSVNTADLANNAVTTAKLASRVFLESVSVGTSLSVGTGTQSLTLITITAPANGTVLLLLSGEASIDSEGAGARIGLGTSPSGFELHFTRVGHLGIETFGYYEAFFDMAIVAVSAGPKTFYANAERFGTATPGIAVRQLYLVAVFIPS